MTKKLMPYGSADQARNLSKVSKGKSPHSLVARMPSPEVAAKVGEVTSTAGMSLSPPEPFAKFRMDGANFRRVVRVKGNA